MFPARKPDQMAVLVDDEAVRQISTDLAVERLKVVELLVHLLYTRRVGRAHGEVVELGELTVDISEDGVVTTRTDDFFEWYDTVVILRRDVSDLLA